MLRCLNVLFHTVHIKALSTQRLFFINKIADMSYDFRLLKTYVYTNTKNKKEQKHSTQFNT